jgi:hypothetical protein
MIFFKLFSFEANFGKLLFTYYIYVRIFFKFDAKISSQKKVMRVQSWEICISAGD